MINQLASAPDTYAHSDTWPIFDSQMEVKDAARNYAGRLIDHLGTWLIVLRGGATEAKTWGDAFGKEYGQFREWLCENPLDKIKIWRNVRAILLHSATSLSDRDKEQIITEVERHFFDSFSELDIIAKMMEEFKRDGPQ